MQQTLLVVGAIVAFAFLALGQMRGEQQLDQRDATARVELAAVDLAGARLEQVVGLAFDEDDVGSADTRFAPSARPLGPDAGEHAPEAFDDLDDWHGYAAAATAPSSRGTLTFRETVEVRYVLDDRPSAPAAAPTLTKEVRVTLEESAPPGRRPARVTLQRAVTPVALAVDHTR